MCLCLKHLQAILGVCSIRCSLCPGCWAPGGPWEASSYPTLVPHCSKAQLLMVTLSFFSPPSLKIALAYSLHVADSRDVGRVDGKEHSLPGIERKQRFQNLVKMLLVWSWVGVPDSLQWNGAWKPSSLGVDRSRVTGLSPLRPWRKVEGVLGSFFYERCSSQLGATRSKPGQALVSLLFQAVCLPLCRTPVQSHWLPWGPTQLGKKCLWKAFLL